MQLLGHSVEIYKIECVWGGPKVVPWTALSTNEDVEKGVGMVNNKVKSICCDMNAEYLVLRLLLLCLGAIQIIHDTFLALFSCDIILS